MTSTRRHYKGKNGRYLIFGKSYKKLVGTREQVGKRIAYKTDGSPGLKFEDIKKNNHGKWVSKKLSRLAIKDNRSGVTTIRRQKARKKKREKMYNKKKTKKRI
tara:strand:- start:948 stop:1256 length:309 start_codon:yes stop_codon:yes gene_type:complete